MRASISIAIAAGASLVAIGPAFAQDSEPSVNSYLCQFAGKCGDEPAEPELTKEAPATKGFRMARAAPKPSTPTRDLSPTRSLSAPVRTAAVGRSTAASATRVARTAPAAGRRADLRIDFQLGSDQMTGVGVSKAKIFAESLVLPELSSKRFMIEGHTDSLGTRSSNLDLSRRRAQAVANYLVSQGVDRSRLEVKGSGFDAPIAGRSKADPANRRVEAQLLP